MKNILITAFLLSIFCGYSQTKNPTQRPKASMPKATTSKSPKTKVKLKSNTEGVYASNPSVSKNKTVPKAKIK